MQAPAVLGSPCARRKMPPADASRQTVVLVAASYFGLNLGLSFWNKLALGRHGSIRFTFPIFYTACHQIATLGGASLTFRWVPSTNTLSWEQWRAFRAWIVVLGCLFVVNVGANNTSLVYISLSINTIVKSITPLPTMVLSFALEGKRRSLAISATVFAMVATAVISVPFGDEDNANAFGLALATLSMLAAATRPVMSAILMSGAAQNGLTPLVLVWYDAAISSVLLLLASVAIGEAREVAAYAARRPFLAAVVVLLGSAMAFFYNFVLFKLCDVVGSLNHALFGNAKQVCVQCALCAVCRQACLFLGPPARVHACARASCTPPPPPVPPVRHAPESRRARAGARDSHLRRLPRPHLAVDVDRWYHPLYAPLCTVHPPQHAGEPGEGARRAAPSRAARRRRNRERRATEEGRVGAHAAGPGPASAACNVRAGGAPDRA